MCDPGNGDSLGEDRGIDEVQHDDQEVPPEDPEVVDDWGPLVEWLERHTQQVVLGWYRPSALLLTVLTLLGTSWERILAVGAILLLPILEAVGLLLGRPLIASRSTLTSRHISGSRGSARTRSARPKRK